MKYADNISEFLLAFDPEPLSTRENLDKFYYDGTMPIRTGDPCESPLDDLYEECCKPLEHNAHLLMGHGGCGKSTELNVLKKRLEKEGRNVSVVQSDKEADLPNLVYEDLLILIGKHLIDIVEDLKISLPEKLLQDMADFWKDIEIVTETSTSRQVSINAEAKVSVNIFTLFKAMVGTTGELKYGQVKRKEIREQVDKNSSQWIGYLGEVAGNITTKTGKQPVIIFEDLDKLDLHDPELAWKAFKRPLSMPFPVIYTFPIALSYDTRFASLQASFYVHILPMIKTRTENGQIYDKGFAALRKVVEKRANLLLFENGVLDLLISKTGSSLRALFSCITAAATRAGRRKSITVSREDAERAIINLQSMLTRRIQTSDYDFLKEVHEKKREINDQQMLLNMTRGQIVLEYNSKRWHDLHPLIEDFLREVGELDPQ